MDLVNAMSDELKLESSVFAVKTLRYVFDFYRVSDIPHQN